MFRQILSDFSIVRPFSKQKTKNKTQAKTVKRTERMQSLVKNELNLPACLLHLLFYRRALVNVLRTTGHDKGTNCPKIVHEY